MTPGHVRFRSAATDGSEWVFVSGQRFFVALPITSSRQTVDSFLEVADRSNVSIESLVSLVPVDEPGMSFAIVVLDTVEQTEGEEVSITSVVRGSATVDVFSVGGWRRFSDQGARPWMLADFRSVTAVVIGGIEAPMVALPQSQYDARPRSASSVHGGQLVWSLAPTAETAEPSSSVEDETIIRRRGSRYDRAHEMEDTDGDTVLVALGFRSQREGVASGTVPSGTVPSPSSGKTHINDDSVMSPEPASESQQPAIPPASADGAPAGLWASADLPDPIHPGIHTAPAGFYRFRVGDGDAIVLTVDAFIGRRPRSPRVPSATQPQLITVASPRREVSGTHVKIAQEGSAVVVTDLGSMNGTVVSIPGARALRLRQAEAVVVTPGTRLDIGDGNIIEILSIAQ